MNKRMCRPVFRGHTQGEFDLPPGGPLRGVFRARLDGVKPPSTTGGVGSISMPLFSSPSSTPQPHTLRLRILAFLCTILLYKAEISLFASRTQVFSCSVGGLGLRALLSPPGTALGTDGLVSAIVFNGIQIRNETEGERPTCSRGGLR